MPVRDTRMDADVTAMLTYADDHLGTWVPLQVLDDRLLTRTVRWMVYSKHSPLGWSPDGRVSTARRSYDLQWMMRSPTFKRGDDDQYTRDIHVPGVYVRGLRYGRIKLMEKQRKPQM